jgi:hypothetical protein
LPPPDPGADPEPAPTPEEKLRFEELAELSPRAAISEIRREIEQAVISLVEKHGFQGSSGNPVNLMSGIRLLRNHNVIDRHVSALLDDLRSIGNAAAHAEKFSMSKDEALFYRELADVLLRVLR